MNKHCMSAAIALAIALPLPATAAGVTITAPADGAMLNARAKHEIAYEVDPGPSGDHVHLYVDDKEVAVLRKLKGAHVLESLVPGQHTLCIKVVNRAHTPIGVEGCVRVTAN